MTDGSGVDPKRTASKGRLVTGGTVFVLGQFVPLLVPVVTGSELSTVWKTIVSAFLFVCPELFLLLAIAILGKAGYEFLKSMVMRAVGRFFKKHGPSDEVSLMRYRIGLMMFILPFIMGWLTPYVYGYVPDYASYRLWYGLPGDLLLIISLFVLGGDFWDKLRSLFIHGAKAKFSQ